MANHKRGQYELYKGDRLIARGTVNEIATEMGVKESSIRHYGMPAYKNRGTGKNSMKLFKAGEMKELKKQKWNDILKVL